MGVTLDLNDYTNRKTSKKLCFLWGFLIHSGVMDKIEAVLRLKSRR